MNWKPTAIVVDESNAFLLCLSMLLNRMNLEVLPVRCPAEALELARVTRPSLMTLNMVMPDIDGLEVLRMIRQDKDLSDLPVIMFSSHRDDERRLEACELGCVDVLDKPIELRRLHWALQQCNLFEGAVRQYLRAPYRTTVTIKIGEETQHLPSLTLSERGVYVETKELLRRGQPLKIDLPLPNQAILKLHGRVIYTRRKSGEHAVLPAGMVIKFENLNARDMEQLGEAVTNILMGDIVARQGKAVQQCH